MSKDEIFEINESAASKNTKRTKQTWLTVWQNWCLARNIDNKIECFAPRVLDEILTKFYAEVRKKRWHRVRTRFTSHYTGITRQVSSPKNYSASISSGREFKKSQETLNSDGKCLRYQGKGKRPNRAQPYARIDEELFWSEGKLGSHNGVALTNVNSNSPNYLCVQVIWFFCREMLVSTLGLLMD